MFGSLRSFHFAEKRLLVAAPQRLGPMALAVFLTALGAGCEEGDTDGGPLDSGVTNVDAGPGRDGGEAEPDATEPDATEPDATEPDATEPDATEPDATEPDAGSPEGAPDGGEGETDDAGSGVTDAGRPGEDAGSQANDGGSESEDAGGPVVDAGPQTYAACFSEITPADGSGPNYDQYAPVVDPNCSGTAHQTISGVERVVFLGDSITVGTPPTQSIDFYRARLAAELATRFGLEAPSTTWRIANPLTGMSSIQESGDFASCAEWGARNDDLLQDGTQVVDCLPESSRDQRTLIVLTMGGNDIANMVRRGTDPNVTEDDLWLQVETFVQLLDDTLAWIYTPGRFPNGVFVVFGNLYEYTDGTGDILSCPAASTAGFDEAWEDQALLDALIVYANEQYLRLAVDYQADMTFMLESFCGHGFRADDETGRCYRGPNSERWFDLTCIHPTPQGHEEIANLFLDVIN